jgi:integrase/recombinase XerD
MLPPISIKPRNVNVPKKPESRFCPKEVQIAKHLRAPTTQIEDIIRKARLNYDDTCKVIGEVRRRLEIVRPDRRKRVIELLSSSEANRFLRIAYADAYGPLLQTLFQTGASVSEIIAIRPKNFRAQDDAIIIRKDKDRKKHVIPLLPELARTLRVHLGERRNGYLFETRRAGAYSARRVQQIIAGITRKAKIAKRIHSRLLYPFVAQQLLDGGMTLGKIQTFLGREKIESSQIYAGATPTMIRRAYLNATPDRFPKT